MPAKAGTQQGLKIAGGSEAQINKTDRNDARGIAQMMRVGLYRPVHVKTPVSYTHLTLPTILLV